MSVKRYKLELLSSSQRIRRAKRMLEKMPRLRQIELMDKAGSMTEEQAERARRRLAEMEA